MFLETIDEVLGSSQSANLSSLLSFSRLSVVVNHIVYGKQSKRLLLSLAQGVNIDFSEHSRMGELRYRFRKNNMKGRPACTFLS